MKIEDSKEIKQKRFYLIISIISTLSILFIFKYFDFFNANFEYIAQILHWNYSIESLKLILPIGLSFHTFQGMSYVIEVYRGKQKAERKLGIYSLYVMFYPQLVAGPIERPQNLIHQFYEKHYFDYKRVTDGLKLMLWGFFKKVVIADRLALIVNTFYNDPTGYTGFPLILATVFFAFQIYCDFSGYTDIAIGAAQIMGFKLMDNFKRPYFSRSISEFWKRWHISLSSWFKDYLYIPLGGNKVSIPRWYANLFIVFLVSGLWHGANWTFVVWGALHGFYMISGIALNPLKNKLFSITYLIRFPRIVQLLEIGFTFILVNIGWIFFRANNISDAFYVLTHLFIGINLDLSWIRANIGLTELLISLGVIIFMEFIHLIQEQGSVRQFLDSKPLFVRWALYIMLMCLILLFGVFNKTQFIYFQF